MLLVCRAGFCSHVSQILHCTHQGIGTSVSRCRWKVCFSLSKPCREAGVDNVGSERTTIGLLTDIDTGLAVRRCHVPIAALAARLSFRKLEYSRRKREENAQGHGVRLPSCLPLFHPHLSSFQHINQDEKGLMHSDRKIFFKLGSPALLIPNGFGKD